MFPSHASSKTRFRDYLKRRKDAAWAEVDPTKPDAKPEGDKAKKPRARSFWTIFTAFWAQLAGHKPTVFAALTTLSISTGLGLLLPTSTLLVIDYIVTDNPGPAGLPSWIRLDLLPTFGLAPIEVPAASATPGADLKVNSDQRIALLWLIAAGMIAITLINIVLGIWGRWQTTRITKRLQASMRRRAFEHTARLPLHRIYQMKTGGIVSILRDDANSAADLLFSLIYNPWRAVVQLAGTLIVLASVDWRMLAGGLMLIPVTWLTHKTWIGRIRPVFRDIKLTRTSMDAHATEAFGGMRVVRGFSRESSETSRFTRSGHLQARQEILAWWWSRLLELAWAILIPLASVAVLVYGGIQVIGGGLTIGQIMMFSTYLLMLLSPLETLTNTATTVQNNLAGFDRILDVLEEPREFEDVSLSGAPLLEVRRGEVQGRISIERLWFSYPKAPGKPAPKDAPKHASNPGESTDPKPAETAPRHVLKDVSLEVAPGMNVALVGASGSGKTTLCNLVARFYDPTLGRILLDGIDLRDIEVSSYRRLLGIVEQDVFLFDGSIAENIAYGWASARTGTSTPDGSKDQLLRRVRDAARAANADAFIESLEQGYATLIGERGVRLSGGQKQRIAIARAILADPVILILDEATSNLDAESEALIQRSLAGLMKGRTSFIIAHRLSTIRNADLIVVLDEGRIVETGTHDQLLTRGGRYASLLKAQLATTDASQLDAAGGPNGQAPDGQNTIATSAVN